MTRWIAILLTAVGSLDTSQAYAQDSVPGPGAVVVSIIPAGVTFFTEGTDTPAPSFKTYDFGASIEVHLNHHISVEGEVIGSLGVEQDLRFARQFKAATGVPPHQYVIARRIERAQQLLHPDRDLSLAEVAAIVGFSDQSQFSHHFKRVVGATPGQFRRSAGIV